MLRRTFLTGAGSLFAWSHHPKEALAAGRDPRLLVVILRGGMDGLSVVAPIGDKDYEALRGKIAVTTPFMLDNFFGLHPALPTLHDMYKEKEALFIHAVHSPYRERSHFDGQDVLESGHEKPGFTASGWLNRAFETLAKADRIKPPLGVGPVVPLVARGKAAITAWQTQTLPQASNDLKARIMSMYDATDAELAKALRGSLKSDKPESRQNYIYEAMTGAANFLSQPNGPRLGALSIDGFDTHAGENGQLTNRLNLIDAALPDVKKALGAAWRETVILFITEFGRTARVNGTQGTDHGTATVAMLIGGAVKGGRVIADWPGLSSLHENRDLKATTDLRSVIKGVLADHLFIDMKKYGETIFPGSLMVKPKEGLIT